MSRTADRLVHARATVAALRAGRARDEATAFVGELLGLVGELGSDERRVLLILARRLLEGQRAYGRLDVKNDWRDWRAERAEELEDALVYTAIAELKAQAKAEGRRNGGGHGTR